MIVPRYYEDLSVLHDNTMLARAYYMPASKRMDDLVEHRELSDRMQLLNGTWKFQYFDSIYDMKDAFYEDGYSVESFDEIAVPSVWQMAGYDTHQYTNCLLYTSDGASFGSLYPERISRFLMSILVLKAPT